MLNKFKEDLAVKAFGMTPAETKSTGICIQCHQPAIPKCYSEAGKREYAISGLCEECFDNIF